MELSVLLNTVFLIISWIICKCSFQKGPKKAKLPLLRLPLLALKECILSMDLNEIINLYLCSKYTRNTIKLFKKSYSKGITKCKMEFMEEYCRLEFSTRTSRIRYRFFPKRLGELSWIRDVLNDDRYDILRLQCLSGSNCYYSQIPFKSAKKFAVHFLEISDFRGVEIILYDRIVLEEFVYWGNKYESSIKSVHSLANIGRDTIFDHVKYFKNWRRLVLLHNFNEYHLNQTNENNSVSIISCDDYSTLMSFWRFPHHSIHFSKNVFETVPFFDYLQRWIESSIPCTELVDLTAELYQPNYFDRILRSVKFEVIDEEWIHPIHGKILPPSFKTRRRDRKKSALLFKFQKDGEPCLGMHIY